MGEFFPDVNGQGRHNCGDVLLKFADILVAERISLDAALAQAELKGKSEEELMKLGAPRLLNTCMVSLVFQLFN